MNRAPPTVAPYASNPAESRGRLHAEPESATRTAFQRDRDRIIHCAAFRRLEYKTQVFVYHEGDYYRTRLTHSLETAQIARSICRVLGLNEDLAEALALAHDLGHTPFGHAGEDALARAMAEYGGFDHMEASILAAMGRDQEALAAMRKAIDNGWRRLWLTDRYPSFDHLRGNAEFRALMDRIRIEIDNARGQLMDIESSVLPSIPLAPVSPDRPAAEQSLT